MRLYSRCFTKTDYCIKPERNRCICRTCCGYDLEDPEHGEIYTDTKMMWGMMCMGFLWLLWFCTKQHMYFGVSEAEEATLVSQFVPTECTVHNITVKEDTECRPCLGADPDDPSKCLVRAATEAITSKRISYPYKTNRGGA